MLTAFEVVAGILVHLQGGKKKMKDQLKDMRNKAPPTRGLVNHKFGGSMMMKSFRRSQYMGLSMKSSRRSLMRSSVSQTSVIHQKQYDEEIMRPTDNPLLYHFPTEAYPEYRKMPKMIILSIGSMAMISTYSFFHLNVKTSTMQMQMQMQTDHEDFTSDQQMSYSQLGYILVTSTIVTVLFVAILQDWYYVPSRFSTDTLMKRRWFPSRLSRYSTIDAEIPLELNHDESADDAEIKLNGIGVHFLELKNKMIHDDNVAIDAIHLMHGFGASSLNWINSIESLVEKLSAKVAIAHDGVGFGFTERPATRFGVKKDAGAYTSAAWAMIGNSLVMDRLEKDGMETLLDDDEDDSSVPPQKRVVLIGHSMGAAATLKMALTLPAFEKIVVLVAPALVGSPPQEATGDILHQKQKLNAWKTVVRAFKVTGAISFAYFQKIVVEPIIKYLLARGVGTPGFWAVGLRQTAGKEISEECCLAFQWPSIGRGWEDGLLAFAKSRVLSVCPYAGGELELLDDVLMLPEVSVVIIHGTNDKLVPISMSRDIVEGAIGDIKLVELEGAGHLPMSESPAEFVDLVKAQVDEMLAAK